MKKLLVWTLAVLIFAAVANDTTRYLIGFHRADDAARAAAFAGARSAAKPDRDTAWRAAYAVAEERGARAANIQVTSDGVTVWVAYDVHGTWLAAPLRQLLQGRTDTATLWNTPLTISAESRSPL